jgi:predicted AlkP superfamily phosphohydrolase/phosphomutase
VVTAAVLILAVLLLFSSCQSGVPVKARPERVVMVSYDGVGGDLAWRWIEQGTATDRDGLAAMAAQGLAVRRMRMVNPTLTAPNHAALSTGEPPTVTGIVSNSWRRPGTPISATVMGFAASPQTETLWSAAHRQGVRVGTLYWPGADAGALDRMGDFGVVWPGSPLASGDVVELDPEAARRRDDLPSRDGAEVLWWPLEVGLDDAHSETLRLELAVLDGNKDGRPRYDTLAWRLADTVEWRMVGEREWFGVEFDAQSSADFGTRRYGVWSKPLHMDRFRGGVRLYRGPAYRLRAYPDEFEKRLTAAVGPWPGFPDERLLADWWLDVAVGIDLDTYLEQIERLDRYLDDVTAWVMANEDAQLLLVGHPTADEYQHSSLVVDPDQWAWSAGAAVAASEGLKRVGRSVDRSVGDTWRLLDGSRDVLLVVSDHGHLPIHDQVNIYRVLADAGLLELAPGGRGVGDTSPMTAIASGACAHLYLNRVGREPTGVVDSSETGELLARAARALADLNRDGEPVVERVLRRSEAAELGLDHDNSGDLIAFLMPGFAFSTAVAAEPISPSRYYGQHGYLNHHDAMAGMLFARGAGLGAKHRKELEATEVARLVALWLGFEIH